MTKLQTLEHQLKLTNYAFCLHGKKPFTMENLATTYAYIEEMKELKESIMKINENFDFSKIIEE